MTPHNKQLTYQETFLEEMFERLHHHKVSQKDYTGSVSYTHLTLPTNREV